MLNREPDSISRPNHRVGICYVATDVLVPYFTGASTHVLEASKNLMAVGASVFVLSRRASHAQAAEEVVEGVPIRRMFRGIVLPVPARKFTEHRPGLPTRSWAQNLIVRLYSLYLSTVQALLGGLVAARIIVKNGLDVVLERETSFGAGAVASLLTGRPLVLEANGPRFNRFSLSRATKILAYSYSMVDERVRRKTELMHSGVNPELFRPDLESRSTIRSRHELRLSPVIGYVGTFQAWHGLEDLVQASRAVLQSFPEAKFLMVGPGSDQTRALTEKLGVRASFVFTDAVPYAQVPMYINAADILVSPTNPSGAPWTLKYGPPAQIKILEYMACRKPVISTDTEPSRRIVRDGVTGIAVPPGDPKALSEAICRLIRAPALADELADHAYTLVTERYTWAAHADELYQTILTAMRDYSGRSRKVG